jgi:hypothetical protein|eukprot:COSAG06_NODE_164_length_21596_cov_37.740500_15_plen_58_part_00
MGVSSTCTTCDTQTRVQHCFSWCSCAKQSTGVDSNGRETHRDNRLGSIVYNAEGLLA